MEVVRLGAINPPEKQRSQWAREILSDAIERDLTPSVVPVQEVVSFTVTMEPALVARLKSKAQQLDIPMSRLTAGLIEAALRERQSGPVATAKAEDPSGIPGESAVRDILKPLLRNCVEKVAAGKIVLAEAATGTGKGRMIAAMAANAASKGDTVVISAPLTVTWQLIDALKTIPEAQLAGVTMSLGRPNFISPARALDWAVENGRSELESWVTGGGKPFSSRSIDASAVIDHQLCWLLEDALLLAEDLPIDALMLGRDDEDCCPAQMLYKSMRGNHSEAGIILCSHYMLASHVRNLQMRGLVGELDDEEGEPAGMSLPQTIDTLIVDEAHLLEQAFAAIYSHTLRMRPLIRLIEENGGRGKAAALAALNGLYASMQETVTRSSRGTSFSCRLEDAPDLESAIRGAQSALQGISGKNLTSTEKLILSVAQKAMKDALTGHSRLRVELTPVRNYPMLISGRANLQSALLCLWDSVIGAALVSATLFTDGENGSLTRWKLEIPPSRALYLSPVHPAWTRDPVALQTLRCSIPPDDSNEWAAECAAAIGRISEAAVGGTLVLCTSFQNVEQIQTSLAAALGDRLIYQSKSTSAAMCLAQYRAKHHAGQRPVWLGLGAAWTGIDLSDNLHPDSPELDTMLSDLVITRIPVGLNRSLTQERRVAIGGFKIINQEACWQLRQGLGRLVRRPGVKGKNLWVLDARLDGKETWLSPIRKILSQYATAKNKLASWQAGLNPAT